MTMTTFPVQELPVFTAIDPATIAATITALLGKHKQAIHALLEQQSTYTWQNLMQPLEDMNDELHRLWSPVSHLHSVKETDSLRDAYNETLPVLTTFHTELTQNEKLYAAINAIADRPDYKDLAPAQQKIIQNYLRDFKLSGVSLPKEKKERLMELEQKLSQYTTKFSENVLDATQGFHLHIKTEKELAGLPEQALQLAKENAERRQLDGYVLTLDYPSYSTAMRFLHSQAIRKTMYEAYVTRASDRGPNASKWDNSGVMEVILKIRHEIAQMIGFANYADYSLATKMAKSADDVLTFLNDLLAKSIKMATEEYREVAMLARTLDGILVLEAWDMAYYSEKLCEQTFKFTQEDLRPYFPIQKVLTGLFTIVGKVFGLTIKEEKVDVWHEDVKFFALYDDKQALRAGFYIDLYARPHKRDGAWMDDCIARRKLDSGKIQYPVAYLTCNFMPPVGHAPALLTHDDVLTLFHEFGHCLHHMLTKVDFTAVAGINGVEWDAVEFPSQFLEYFCWEKSSLDVIAEHYETKAPLPESLYEKMIAGKNFQTGLQMVRQLEFSLFDFRLHLEYDVSKFQQVQTILNEIRDQTSLVIVPEYNRFQNSFSHIFAGGYAAGYYSYKWAEVLSADAYELFQANGVLNRQVGQQFMENILEVGGTRDPMESFVAFRGRKPSVDALLRQSGIIEMEV